MQNKLSMTKKKTQKKKKKTEPNNLVQTTTTCSESFSNRTTNCNRLFCNTLRQTACLNSAYDVCNNRGFFFTQADTNAHRHAPTHTDSDRTLAAPVFTEELCPTTNYLYVTFGKSQKKRPSLTTNDTRVLISVLRSRNIRNLSLSCISSFLDLPFPISENLNLSSSQFFVSIS